MSLDRGSSLIGGLVLIALVTTVVVNKNSAAVITAAGRSLAGLFRAAMGR